MENSYGTPLTDLEDRLDQVESIIERQVEMITSQRKQLDRLEAADGPFVVADGGDVKVVGELDATDGTGVLGKATGEGETYGVRGEVTSAEGYGLYTPNDASVGGVLEAEALSGGVTGGTQLETLAGDGLVVEDGALTAADIDVETLNIAPFTIGERGVAQEFNLDIDVQETQGIETTDLSVTLEVEDPDGTPVYDEEVEAEEIKFESTSVTFEGITPDSVGEFSATATADSDGVTQVTETEQFPVVISLDVHPFEVDNQFSEEEFDVEVEVEALGAEKTDGLTVTLELEDSTGTVTESAEIDDVELEDETETFLFGDLSLAGDAYMATVTASADNAFSDDEEQVAFTVIDSEIEDWEDFHNVRDQPEDAYILVNDLDENTDGYDEYVNGDGFEPIDDFSGTFDGNGHIIADLVLDALDDIVLGLFRFVPSEGHIRDLGLENVHIDSGGTVGGLVGENDGVVDGSYVTGLVEGYTTAGALVGSNSGEVNGSYATATVDSGDSAGGLVGENEGIISGSYATGSVETGDPVGGLVAVNSGEVTESYATGAVDGTDPREAGGLTGENTGVVSDSYATGYVYGTHSVGGLVGENEGVVSRSFATGSLDPLDTDDVGGLVGDNPGEMKGSYWDMESTGELAGTGTGTEDGMTGLKTDEMQGDEVEDNMDDLDFVDIWEAVSEADEATDADDYPVLQVLDRGTQLDVRT